MRWRKNSEPSVQGHTPDAAPVPPPRPDDGKERLTANEWAQRHQVNQVLAERAAMYAGKWHEPITEEEFLAFMRDKRL